MKKCVINLAAFDEKPKFGSILRQKRSDCLYIDFYYFERRVRLSTKMDDTTENREQLTKFLNTMGRRIEERTFCFAEAFDKADESLKRFFSEKEQRKLHPKPEHVLFGDYAKRWKAEVLPRHPHSKQIDYTQIIDYWLIPKLKKLPFTQITGTRLEQFIQELKHKDGPNKGKPLSAHRKRNIMIPLKKIWKHACTSYNWNTLMNPFDAAKEEINLQAGSEEKKEREIFLHHEWQQLLAHMDPYYHPLTEIQLLTGMIASELRGLRKEDVSERFISVRQSISRGVEKKGGKTQYRKREIPVTAAIRRCLIQAMAASTTDHVFTMKNNVPVNFSTYRNIWDRAMNAAGLFNKTPYSTRHSLVQWSLLAGMAPVRLVEVMGHRDKSMIFGTYGRYRHGLAEERQEILNYLGKDFISPETTLALVHHSETHSETKGPDEVNYSKVVGF